LSTIYAHLISIIIGVVTAECKLKVPSALVYAFDTNDEARRLCEEMAAVNGVGDRVIVRSLCDPSTLEEIASTSRAFILCDCEGCEKELFNKKTVAMLCNHDLIIETHDFLMPSISKTLLTLFQKSHSVSQVVSNTDIEKARHYDYRELRNYCFWERRILLGEYRPKPMKWLVLMSRNFLC